MSFSKPFKRKLSSQPFSRRTRHGIVPTNLRSLSPPAPPPPPPPRKRHRTPQKVLDEWITTFMEDFVPFESLSKTTRDAQAAEPQHFEDGTTNPKWKQSRMNKVSGTKASKLTDLHDYSDFNDGLKDMIWDRFQQVLDTKPEIAWKVKWGHDHEPDAGATLLEFLRSPTGQTFLGQFEKHPTEITSVQHLEYGFVQSIALPFTGTSPDGVIEITYADQTKRRHEVEFKCKTKGWYKNSWPEDQWPQDSLYPLKRLPGNKVFPIPTAYYVQIMWCVLIMGKHDLSSLLGIQGDPKHFEAFRKYLEPHLHKTKSKHFGEQLLDADAPIMFTVWAPGNTKNPHEGEPEIYKKLCFDFAKGFFRSVMVKCPGGCLQVTMVDYDHVFAVKTMQHAFYAWKMHWVPRLAMKAHGMILPDELDPPLNSLTDTEDSEEEEEEESSEEEKED